MHPHNLTTDNYTIEINYTSRVITGTTVIQMVATILQHATTIEWPHIPLDYSWIPDEHKVFTKRERAFLSRCKIVATTSKYEYDLRTVV